MTAAFLRFLAALRLAWQAFRLGLRGWRAREYILPGPGQDGRPVWQVHETRADFGLGPVIGWRVSSGGVTYNLLHRSPLAAALVRKTRGIAYPPARSALSRRRWAPCAAASGDRCNRL